MTLDPLQPPASPTPWLGCCILALGIISLSAVISVIVTVVILYELEVL
jgi:hypothetical protein